MFMRALLREQKGQGTVEAAVVIPVLFLLMLMLIQPGIVLYDHIVMGNAAAEGCRLIATKTDVLGSMDGSCEAFVRHRLASIPQQDCFHVHEGGCSYRIAFEGGEDSEYVTVRISNELRPLPLFDAGARLLGMTNASGNLTIEKSVTMPTQPSWVAGSEEGLAPGTWVGAWCS